MNKISIKSVRFEMIFQTFNLLVVRSNRTRPTKQNKGLADS